MRNREMLFHVFVQWLLLLQDKAPVNFKLHHPTTSPPPPPPRLGNLWGHLNFLKGQVHGIVHVWVWQYLIVFKPIGSELDVRREIYAGLSISFGLILYVPIIHILCYSSDNYVLQPVRIRFTALSCSETNIYLRVFLWGLLHTHANKAVTNWQTKFVNKPK